MMTFLEKKNCLGKSYIHCHGNTVGRVYLTTYVCILNIVEMYNHQVLFGGHSTQN